ncbi:MULTISPECIES: hypothetical protein [Undibacterium]|jgi:hypothetical protein|uniref:Uncharacterized protein n=1 Tax=Undibacterium aquatile TaxID=1537398 RepID=A0ABR6XD60_9BURK|nr:MULTISPECIES: hypothetical protein [Undibacterium]MBY0570132.1 hypothetical protein [Burkholderiaceae bacterium]MBC3810846.1 hypothetical protein [Undibacterium aquatile]MBC3878930.1 hypothetical protein [Undibacterium sp. FT79W]MBC3928324.1 hypothetical protein [Undibacterium sp. CY21W]MBK1890913.1 hypothetical protein [Undibacterium sp. 14-3-2]
MQIDIYQSVAQPKKHLSVAANTDIKLLNLEDPDYADVRLIQRGFDTLGLVKPVALDVAAAIAGIESEGYYLHSADIEIGWVQQS